MVKSRMFILSLSIVCIIIAAGLLFWFPQLLADWKLHGYIERLEKKGYIIEEHLLSDSDFDDSITMKYFSDLTFAANWEGTRTLYFDRGIQAIYFLKSTGDKTEAHIFQYMLARDE